MLPTPKFTAYLYRTDGRKCAPPPFKASPYAASSTVFIVAPSHHTPNHIVAEIDGLDDYTSEEREQTIDNYITLLEMQWQHLPSTKGA